MQLPFPGRFSSVNSIEGDIYGTHYHVTVGDFGSSELGLVLMVSISGTEDAIALALGDFIGELGEPVSNMKIPGPIEGRLLRIYFWPAKPVMH